MVCAAQTLKIWIASITRRYVDYLVFDTSSLRCKFKLLSVDHALPLTVDRVAHLYAPLTALDVTHVVRPAKHVAAAVVLACAAVTEV